MASQIACPMSLPEFACIQTSTFTRLQGTHKHMEVIVDEVVQSRRNLEARSGLVVRALKTDAR